MKAIVGMLIVLESMVAVQGFASERIRLNQVGYYPTQAKIAVVDSVRVRDFTIVDASTGEFVLRGKPAYVASSAWSRKRRTVLDFSGVTSPGNYLLVAAGDTVRFRVAGGALSSLACSALKAFYYQRSGIPIEERYAGRWNRPAGHPDEHVLVHSSAVGPERKEGTVIASPKGWYDAGDYNKYVVNSAFSIGLMQASYALFPDYYKTQNANIPESGNATPDLLDEMHYNLSWMLTMQDPADGGVYHKLTTPAFEGFIRPADCKQTRYVVQKSVTATLGFAAVMAQSSRLFLPYEQDYPGFSAQALAAAKRAYAWAEANPTAYYNQESLNERHRPAILTGAYGDTSAVDEFFWASSELYLSTGKNIYRQKAMETQPDAYAIPSWANTSSLGVFAWIGAQGLNKEDAAFALVWRKRLVDDAARMVKETARAPFHTPYGNDAKDFFWGCLAERCGNQGFTLLYAYLLTGDKQFLVNAHHNMDYLLGRNATGYCYVSGFGVKSPLHMHHRLSASDGIAAPIPGFLVGGPNPGKQDGLVYPSEHPDECYIDVEESYASNEIAINWNASLVALTSALDALHAADE